MTWTKKPRSVVVAAQLGETVGSLLRIELLNKINNVKKMIEGMNDRRVEQVAGTEDHSTSSDT